MFHIEKEDHYFIRDHRVMYIKIITNTVFSGLMNLEFLYLKNK